MKKLSREGYKAKFGHVCMLCLLPGGEIHHIIPLSRKGPDCEENWILLCHRCHTTNRLHSLLLEAEIPLRVFKHFAELTRLGVPISEISREMGIPASKIKKVFITEEIKRDTPKFEPIPCPCGCGTFTPSRSNQLHRNRRCKDTVRNRTRYLKQKEAVRLARLILELHERGGA
jgi:hypothetical protein